MRSSTDYPSIRYNLLPIALVSLGSVVAACTANQPPSAPTYPIVAAYPAPPHRPARPHNRPTAPETRDIAKPPPEAAPEKPAEPIALLATPPPTMPELPGPGLGETQEAQPAPSPRDLRGMDQARVMRLFGPAMASESRGPATVWHYKSSRCELDLVFYMEMRSGEMRSLHQDFKGIIDNPQQRQACLRAIVQENSRSAATTP